MRGVLPTPEHHAEVAYLGGGTERVAEWLMASAVAWGWLVPQRDDPSRFMLVRSAVPRDALQQRFFEAVMLIDQDAPRADEVWQLAACTAKRQEQAFTEALREGGMVPATWLVAVRYLGAALRFVLLSTVVRGACLLAMLTGAVLSTFTFQFGIHAGLWLFIGGAAGLWLLRGQRFDGWQRFDELLRAEYLEWLRKETCSLCRDVDLGERRDPEDVSLAVAVLGLKTLRTAPRLIGLPARLPE